MQKAVQWMHGDGTEKCIFKYSIDYQYGSMEMESFGRKDKYFVVKCIRLANVNVPGILPVTLFRLLDWLQSCTTLM